MKSLNDTAWEELFNKHNILEIISREGLYIISSDDIRVVRETRLMTKFDYSGSLPDIFKENKLSIVPIKRNLYLISHHNMFKKFRYTIGTIKKIYMPSHIESIDTLNITSEAIALNTSYITGMLEDFTGDIGIYPTVSGRMSSKGFKYYIHNHLTKVKDEVRVDNAQIEIDGAFEGKKFLTLVEAKKTINNDFIIRQLYYPFRLWEDKINKPIKLIFMLHSNRVFSLYEYKFKDSEDYNSLCLMRSKHYSLEDIIITRKDIDNIVENIKLVDEPNVPFPQANSVNRIINICEILEDKNLTALELQEEYEFDKRQVNYYTDAAIYLGLVAKSEAKRSVIYTLTDNGKKLVNLPYIQRQLFFVERILEHKVFLSCYKKSRELNRSLETNEIVDIMISNVLYGLGKQMKDDGLISSTYPRRASTIKKWLLWIESILYN